jgi:hypothetical protein
MTLQGKIARSCLNCDLGDLYDCHDFITRYERIIIRPNSLHNNYPNQTNHSVSLRTDSQLSIKISNFLNLNKHESF